MATAPRIHATSGVCACTWSAPWAGYRRYRLDAAGTVPRQGGRRGDGHLRSAVPAAGFDPGSATLWWTASTPARKSPEPGFDPGGMGLDAEPLAALGFVVVAVDGRGIPGRSKAFHDASYGNLADAGSLDDHVAALRQLAQTRPWMDLDRAGAFGHSGGGFATVRAMLDFPEVCKAGVALSGSHDARYFSLDFVEATMGGQPRGPEPTAPMWTSRTGWWASDAR